MKHILLIGNSHLVSVLDAALRLSGVAVEPGRMSELWRTGELESYDLTLPGREPVRARFIVVGGLAPPLVRIDGDAFMRIDPHALVSVPKRYLRALDDGVSDLEGRVDQVVSCFLGSEHSIFSLIEHPTPFDVLLDGADLGVAPEGPPRQIVPLEVVRRELATRAKPTVTYCEILRSRFPEQDVVHLMPPPPIPDDEQVRLRPKGGAVEGLEGVVQAVYAQLIEEFGVAPAALRRKVYLLFTDVLRAELGPRGVRLLTAPETAVADGFLKPEFWMEATHANHGYGRLVLEQLGAA
jgi:hypothetical protein